MRTLLIFQLSICAVLSAHSQSFGLPGTSWKHCLTPEFSPLTELIHVVSEESTTFQGNECYILRAEEFWKFAGATVDSVIICNIGDQVYYAEGDSLHLVYDFSVQAGGKYTMRFPLELNPAFAQWFPEESLYWDIYVDSVKTVEIDGISLRRQYIHYFDENRGHAIWLRRYVTERIGYQTWILPFLSIDWAEYNPHCLLQEFTDADIHEIDSMSPCLTSATNRIGAHHDVRIWPNPCTNELYVEADTGTEILDMRLMSLDATVIVSGLRARIDVGGIPTGIYILKLVLPEGLVVRKIIKK